MPKTISKRTTSATGKHTLKRRLKSGPRTKTVRMTGSSKDKKKKAVAYSIENDPMAKLLIADGFREMPDAEYEKVRPYLVPKKAWHWVKSALEAYTPANRRGERR